jgi:hypothetical protein
LQFDCRNNFLRHNVEFEVSSFGFQVQSPELPLNSERETRVSILVLPANTLTPPG